MAVSGGQIGHHFLLQLPYLGLEKFLALG